MPEHPVPVSGAHALLLDQIGRDYAQAMRASRAPHQQAIHTLPPEMLGAPGGAAAERFGPRFAGANALALRLAMSEKGQTDPRHATVARAAAINRAAGSSRRTPVLDPSEAGPSASPASSVLVASHRGVPVPALHVAAGRGYGPQGAPGGLVDVAPGDPVRDQRGRPVVAFHERRAVYQVYNVEDLSIAGVEPGGRPRPSTGPRARAAQDARFAERCEAAGEPQRPPTDAERRELNADIQLERLIDRAQAEARDASVPLRVDFDRPGLAEAAFSVHTGDAVISVPPPDAFPDAEARASSVARALAHAALHRDLVEACRPLQVPGSASGESRPPALVVRQPDTETLQRLRAYEADPPSPLDRHHLDMADLAVDWRGRAASHGAGRHLPSLPGGESSREGGAPSGRARAARRDGAPLGRHNDPRAARVGARGERSARPAGPRPAFSCPAHRRRRRGRSRRRRAPARPLPPPRRPRWRRRGWRPARAGAAPSSRARPSARAAASRPSRASRPGRPRRRARARRGARSAGPGPASRHGLGRRRPLDRPSPLRPSPGRERPPSSFPSR